MWMKRREVEKLKNESVKQQLLPVIIRLQTQCVKFDQKMKMDIFPFKPLF